MNPQIDSRMQLRTINYWRKRVFWLCWSAYTLAYLGRVNLSIGIPLIEDSMVLNRTAIGIIGSAYFWTYAFGQLFNGRLGDKFPSRYFVFVGIVLSAITNLIFSFTTSVTIMIVLWALNGYFQSMLWGPIMKTVNRWFSTSERNKIALYMCTSFTAGFLLAWGGLGLMSSIVGWKGIFRIPGVILLIYAFIWFIFIRNGPGETGIKMNPQMSCVVNVNSAIVSDSDRENDPEITFNQTKNECWPVSAIAFISSSKLYLLAFAGIPLGFIREGINLWGPVMLHQTFSLNLQSTMVTALVIPLFNFIGVVAARLFITYFHNDEKKVILTFFTGAILSCILLYILGKSGIVIYLILLALCSSCFYGATSVITSIIPLKYHMTSFIAGFLDFTIYLGAGLSGIVTGALSSKIGWDFVILLWIVVGIAGSISVYFIHRR